MPAGLWDSLFHFHCIVLPLVFEVCTSNTIFLNSNKFPSIIGLFSALDEILSGEWAPLGLGCSERSK